MDTGPLLLVDSVPPTPMAREEFFAEHPQYAYTWDRDHHIKGTGTDGIDDGLCVCRECRELSQQALIFNIERRQEGSR